MLFELPGERVTKLEIANAPLAKYETRVAAAWFVRVETTHGFAGFVCHEGWDRRVFASRTTHLGEIENSLIWR